MNNVNEKNLILTRAKSAVISHDFSTAARLYKQLLKTDPSNVDYLKELGSIYVKNGEDEKAIPYYEQIITFYPHYIEAMNSLGAIYRRLKRYEESIEILQRALEEDRQLGIVNYNLGFTYKEMKNYDDAIDAFEITISENPSDVLAYNHLGKIYFEKKEYSKSIASYKKGLQIDQNHPILNYNLAVCYDEAKMYTEAIRCYEAALRAKPGWVDAIREFSNLLINCQKTKEASDLVHHSIELYPNDADLLCLLGRIYLNQFDYDAAAKTFKKAEIFNKDNTQILSGLAEALEKGEKPQEALDAVMRALEIEPENKDIKKQYVHTLLSAQEYDAAIINVQDLVNENGGNKDIQVLDLCEQYCICVNDEENAKKYSDQIVKIDKHYKNHILEAAARYAQIGDNENAEKKAKEFVARQLRNPAGYNMLGKIYANSGNLQSAIDAYDKSRSLRKPNILADKQIKKLQEQLNKTVVPEEKTEEEQIIEEEKIEEEPQIVEAEEQEETEEEFDFEQLGGNVPMEEALLEEEEEFFDKLDEEVDEDDVEVVDEDGDEKSDSVKTDSGKEEKQADENISDDDDEPAKYSAANSEDKDNEEIGGESDEEDDEDFDFGQFDEKSSDDSTDDYLDDNPYETQDKLEPLDEPFDYQPENNMQQPPFEEEIQPPVKPEMKFPEQPQPEQPQPQQPPYVPQMQPPVQNPYVDAMQKQLQDAMMQSSRYAMDAAMEAQKLAQQIAGEQELLKNRMNEMEERQSNGFYNKPVENQPEETVTEENDIEETPVEEAAVEENPENIEDGIEENVDVETESAASEEELISENEEDSVFEDFDVEEDTGTFVGNETLTEDETESLIGEPEEIDDTELFDIDDSVEIATESGIDDSIEDNLQEEVRFPTVDEILHDFEEEPEDLIPEVDDIQDFDLDDIVDESIAEDESVSENESLEEETEEIDSTDENKDMTSPEKLLPTIERILENEDKAAENASEIEMFKKLISLSDFLPEDKKELFLVGKQRMQMEYLIAKMSGKPGLLKTTQSLRKAVILDSVENQEKVDDVNISNHTVKKVINIMKKLSCDLQDQNLAKALCLSADNVLERIELEDKKSQIFVE